jgi:hypothetical protein
LTALIAGPDYGAGWVFEGHMGYVEKLLSADEKILLRQKQHWAVISLSIVSLLFQGLILLALIQIFDVNRPPDGLVLWLERWVPQFRFYVEKATQHLPVWFFKGFVILYLVKMALTFITGLLSWLKSEEMVTSRRVIHISGILSKTVVDSSLEKINDVLLRQSLLGRLLGYGQVSIMTASEVGLNHMSFLKNPVEFKRVMMDAKRDLSVSMPEERVAGRKSVAERMADLESLKKQGLIRDDEYEAKRKKILEAI